MTLQWKYQHNSFISPLSRTQNELRCLLAILSCFAIPITGHAEQASDQPQEMRLQSEVQGQRSQPKVLFILPWEEKLTTQDIEVDDSIISEEDFLAPIDRTIFQRQLKMYKQLEKTP